MYDYSSTIYALKNLYNMLYTMLCNTKLGHCYIALRVTYTICYIQCYMTCYIVDRYYNTT